MTWLLWLRFPVLAMLLALAGTLAWFVTAGRE